MKIAIEVSDLIKSYGNHIVIRGITFSVNQGEICGLLGANGAGKTTILECIEGLRKYDSGKIVIQGTIGVQLQSSSLPANITALEAYKLFCKWNNASEDLGLFHTFGLSDLKSKQYRAMSTGQKRRLHLALALINDPDIVFLDEPTAGLDVEARVSLHEEIRKLKRQGKTIIIASHDMAEVEDLCDRIVIIKDGNIAYIGQTKELTNNYVGDNSIYIKTVSSIKDFEFNHCNYSGIEQGYFVFKSKNIGDALLEVLTFLKETKNDIVDIRIQNLSLEDQFMQIAKGG